MAIIIPFVPFVGSGTVEDVGQWVWDHDSVRGVISPGGAQRILTMGGVMRTLKQMFSSHVKIDVAGKIRTIFDEFDGVIATVLTKDGAGAPSVDPIFETLPPLDSTRPTIISNTPRGAEVDVSLTSLVIIVFSELMNPATLVAANITFTTAALVAVPFSIRIVGRTVTLTPASPLSPSTGYIVTVGTGVKDVAGNALLAPLSFTFTTSIDCEADLPPET